MRGPLHLSLKTLPGQFFGSPLNVDISHIVHIGGQRSIQVLQTTSSMAVSRWFDSLDSSTSTAGSNIVAGLTLLTQRKDEQSKSYLSLIVLCIGSACLFYYHPRRVRFCNFRKSLQGLGVASALSNFCARPDVKIVFTGTPKGINKLSKCGVEFGQFPIMLMELVVRHVLHRAPVLLWDDTGDAVTTAILGRPVRSGKMTGNTHDKLWSRSSLCQFVLKTYVASEVGKKTLLS